MIRQLSSRQQEVCNHCVWTDHEKPIGRLRTRTSKLSMYIYIRVPHAVY